MSRRDQFVTVWIPSGIRFSYEAWQKAMGIEIVKISSFRFWQLLRTLLCCNARTDIIIQMRESSWSTWSCEINQQRQKCYVELKSVLGCSFLNMRTYVRRGAANSIKCLGLGATRGIWLLFEYSVLQTNCQRLSGFQMVVASATKPNCRLPIPGFAGLLAFGRFWQ